MNLFKRHACMQGSIMMIYDDDDDFYDDGDDDDVPVRGGIKKQFFCC